MGNSETVASTISGRVPTQESGRSAEDPIPGANFQMEKSREIVLDAVERGLSVLGENVPEVVFTNLEKRFSLTKGQIADKPEQFAEALRLMFGSGAVTVEKVIVELFCEMIGVNPAELNPSTLTHCVAVARKIGGSD
jgi:hypothetical protein